MRSASLNWARHFALGLATLLKASAAIGPTAAQAQDDLQLHSLKSLSGYTATVIDSQNEARKIYNELPLNIFKSKSQCHQRAHYWSVGLEKNKKIRSLKAYIFFTDRYNREFDYDWDYHVAPALVVHDSGKHQVLVLDPTFVSAPRNATAEEKMRFHNGPVTLSEWADYFVFPTKDRNFHCPIIDEYRQFSRFQELHYCYILLTPMYNYIPDSLAVETSPRTEWRTGDLREMLNGLISRP
jgi:hypothetical protein